MQTIGNGILENIFGKKRIRYTPGIATRAKLFHVQIRGATCILSQEIGSDITYRTPIASRPIPNLGRY
jgi:hypothetical protein